MNSFSIKDIENLSGIKAHTIRMWEQRYAFIKPMRTNTNIRYYNNNQLKSFLNIALLIKNGFKISHINKLSESEITQKIISLFDKQAQHEKVLIELIECMIETDVDNFEVILNKQIKINGIEKTITKIIFPFLQKIGILWMTNHINAAQEHLVTNIIRQKLLVGIESVSPLSKVKKMALLFLPEGEYHELGLLYVYYLLKRKGISVFYLGANVPLSDLEKIIYLKKPDFIYTHLTAIAKNFNFQKFLFNLKKNIAKIPAIISGPITHTYQKKITPPLYFKKSLAEVVEFISELN